MVWVGFKGLVGKRVKIVMNDGYLKVGRVEESCENFIVIVFDNNKRSLISLNSVKEIQILDSENE